MDDIESIGVRRLEVQQRRAGLGFYKKYLQTVYEAQKEKIVINTKDQNTDLVDKGKAQMLQILISELTE